MIIIDFIYVIALSGTSVAELYELESYRMYVMLASLPVLALWCGLRIGTRNTKNDQMYLLVLVLVANSLRTIAQTNISEMYS